MFDLPDPHILAKPVQPEAAIKFWKDRAKLTGEQAKALEGGARSRAFYVTGLSRMDQVNAVHTALQQALEEGKTLAQFREGLGDLISKQGWESYRVENIFRTNMQTAYAAGRYAQMQTVKKSRPYWQYLAVGDKRTRPSHRILHEQVYPADHAFWDENYPPNGFRCRCTVRTLSERQVKALSLEVQTEIPGDSMWTDPKTGMEIHVAHPGADAGFRNNPGKDWLAGLNASAIAKLDAAADPVAQAMVRTLAQGSLERWMENPSGDFPLAVLSAADTASIGGTSKVASLSLETFAKQKIRHPELTVKDYQLAQDAVEHGDRIQQDKRNLVYTLNNPGGVAVVVKATVEGSELYVTSLRRMSEREAEREKVIGRLKRRNQADEGA